MKNAKNKIEKDALLTGIEKVTVKADKAEQVIKDSKEALSDDQLTALLDNINMDAVIAKTAKNRSIWNDKAKAEFGKTEKSARRKLRTLQLSLSSSVIRFSKLKDTTGVKASAMNLKKFYSDYLVDFSKYSNISEESNLVNFNIVHTAYKIMNK